MKTSRESEGKNSVKCRVNENGDRVTDEIARNNISLSNGRAGECDKGENDVIALPKNTANHSVPNGKSYLPPRKLSLVSNCSVPLPPLSPCFIEVLDETDANNILDGLFKQVDTDNSGFIGIDEVIDICSKFGSSEEESNLIFKHLDKDGDGLISFEDFTAGFNEYKMQLMYLQPLSERRTDSDNDSWANNSGDSTSCFGDPVDDVKSTSGDPISPNFILDNSSTTPSDSLLESLMDKVNRLKEENQFLTASLIK